MDHLWIAVLSSAAIGAIVSAGITELGKWRERKSRRAELVVGKAAEMAISEIKLRIELFKDTEKSAVQY